MFAGLPLLLWTGSGCAKEKAGTPAWIQVDSFPVTTTVEQGSRYQHFTDAWVYVNSNLVGAFELPARIPILAEGPTEVFLYPGVQLNGLSALRTPYLKLDRYQETLNLVPGQTTEINPTLEYDSLVQFKLVEDFENGSKFQKSDGAYGDYLPLENAWGVAFEGQGCGYLTHNGAENTVTQMETLDWYTLPTGDVGGIYLEFNYKCNTSFTVSLLAKTYDGLISKIGVIGINATSTWKKIYIALSPTVNSFTTGNQFKPAIGYTRQIDIATQDLYIDNVKILY